MRGDGTVYKPKYTDKATKEKRESAVWWISWSRDGEKIRESSGSRDRRVARDLLRDRLAAVARGQRVGPDVDSATYNGMAKALEDFYVVNKRRSLKRLKGALAHLGEYFRGSLARTIDETRVGGYVRYRLDQDASNGTINRELTTLKRMFTLAVRARKVARRPHIEMLAEATPRKGFVERAQLDAIVSHLPERLRPVVLAAYLTGWRVASEILTREWRHVDLTDGWLRLEPGETKNGKGRMFPLIPELRAVLEAQRTYTDEVERKAGRVVPLVFHRRGKRIATFQKSWNNARQAAGLAHIIPHDLRRSAVRNLERAGVPRSTAMEMVGHKTMSIYTRYAIVDEAMLQEGAAKLAAYQQAARAAVSPAPIVFPAREQVQGRTVKVRSKSRR